MIGTLLSHNDCVKKVLKESTFEMLHVKRKPRAWRGVANDISNVHISFSERNIVLICRRLFRLLCISRLSANPFKRTRRYEPKNQEVLSPEAYGVVPSVALFV